MVRITVTAEVRDQIMQRVDWDRLRAMTDDEITKAIEDDPDASPLTYSERMAVRVQMIRRQLGLSQSEFAERFRLPLPTLRDWEQGRRVPDAAAISYLQVIRNERDAVIRALSHAG
jgi:putative transcriptional regulator